MAAQTTEGLIRVGIAGATGYAGQELIRLLARHPRATLTIATASQATSTPRRLPGLARIWDGEVRPLDVDALASSADAVFLALPEAASADLAPRLLGAGRRVIDLSGAFRLRDEATRAKWYPATGVLPDGVAYGLTEFEAPAIRTARLLSNPGCYPPPPCWRWCRWPRPDCWRLAPTSSSTPSRASRAPGKAPSDRTHFSENHGSVAAYGVFGHRHTPEMEQALGQRVTFVPHLVPLDRGILESIYAHLRAGHDDRPGRPARSSGLCGRAVRAPHRRALPEIKHVAHTNFCDIGWKVDEANRARVSSQARSTTW
jgi:N-acetyl-gamma-glutamyl-phosphate reductase